MRRSPRMALSFIKVIKSRIFLRVMFRAEGIILKDFDVEPG